MKDTLIAATAGPLATAEEAARGDGDDSEVTDRGVYVCLCLCACCMDGFQPSKPGVLDATSCACIPDCTNTRYRLQNRNRDTEQAPCTSARNCPEGNLSMWVLRTGLIRSAPGRRLKRLSLRHRHRH